MKRRIERFDLGSGAVILHSEKGPYMLVSDHKAEMKRLEGIIIELTRKHQAAQKEVQDMGWRLTFKTDDSE